VNQRLNMVSQNSALLAILREEANGAPAGWTLADALGPPGNGVHRYRRIVALWARLTGASGAPAASPASSGRSEGADGPGRACQTQYVPGLRVR
jgi:hypothetical protein